MPMTLFSLTNIFRHAITKYDIDYLIAPPLMNISILFIDADYDVFHYYFHDVEDVPFRHYAIISTFFITPMPPTLMKMIDYHYAIIIM